MFAIAAGDILAVKQVVDVNPDGGTWQAKTGQIVFHRSINQRITGHVKVLILIITIVNITNIRAVQPFARADIA